MKRGEALIVIGLVGIGFAWSWWGTVYDLLSPVARVIMTLLSLVLAFLLMWGGLAVARAPRESRFGAAIWAILPWNSALLSQIAYVGYLFIPLEVLASTLLLRQRANLSRGGSLVLAAVTRAAVFVVIVAATSVARRWLPR